jgi:hypothetical protein
MTIDDSFAAIERRDAGIRVPVLASRFYYGNDQS